MCTERDSRTACQVWDCMATLTDENTAGLALKTVGNIERHDGRSCVKLDTCCSLTGFWTHIFHTPVTCYLLKWTLLKANYLPSCWDMRWMNLSVRCIMQERDWQGSMLDALWPQGCEGRICREEGQMSVWECLQKPPSGAWSDKRDLY